MEIDKKAVTVTLDMETYEFMDNAVKGRRLLRGLLERANKDGKAVMTDELRECIEEIYM